MCAIAIKALWVDFWETMDWVQLLEQLVVFGLSCLNRRLFHTPAVDYWLYGRIGGMIPSPGIEVQNRRDVFIFQLLGLCHSCPLSYLRVILFSFLQAQNQLAIIIRQKVVVHLIDMKGFIDTLIIMTLGRCTGN